MFDTLTPHSKPGDFETMARARPDPGGFRRKPGPAHAKPLLT